MMKILGITGRSGSGKGYVCTRFAAHGITPIDTDKIVHALYRENRKCIAELEAVFGDLTTQSGEIDRKKLGEIVFADRDKLAKLNIIVHRYVADEIRRICAGLEAEDVSAVLIDAPQLFEAHLENCCDCVIAVVAPEDLRIERICQRDGISAERAQIRLEHQLDDLFLEGHADYIIMNDGLTDIDSQVNAILDDMGL